MWEKDREDVEKKKSVITMGDNLNLGCGFNKMRGFINVDAYDICKPDVVWDLNKMPWPWPDNTIDHIFAAHILEHLEDWWGAFKECARILKPMGTLEVRVPDESESSAGTYRDHKHIISRFSFYGIQDTIGLFYWTREVNAWAEVERHTVPLAAVGYGQVPHPQYQWMVKWCPWLLRFCSVHMRNFIHEQRFMFRKIGDEKYGGS